MSISFGRYFKEVRKKHNKTQLDLAEAIGKTTMLISGIENGKNSPPRGEDLKTIMHILELTKEEKIEMIDKIAQDTNSLPEDIGTFILSDNKVRTIIRAAQNNKLTNRKFQEIIQILEEE